MRIFSYQFCQFFNFILSAFYFILDSILAMDKQISGWGRVEVFNVFFPVHRNWPRMAVIESKLIDNQSNPCVMLFAVVSERPFCHLGQHVLSKAAYVLTKLVHFSGKNEFASILVHATEGNRLLRLKSFVGLTSLPKTLGDCLRRSLMVCKNCQSCCTDASRTTRARLSLGFSDPSETWFGPGRLDKSDLLTHVKG